MAKPADSCPGRMKRSHRKVKSGCRTCKARKVKCDQGWPACRACVTTGRVCEGYGIWGGGGNRYEQRRAVSAAPNSVPTTQCNQSTNLLVQGSPFKPLIPVSDTEEHLHFQFFKEHTLAKLPGSYSTKYDNLWERLVVQACAEEPAIMHAVLAISSAHRRKVLNGASRSKVLVHPDKQEEFLLRNYCKSIQYLQPRFHTCGENSIRTTLIACLLFIYLELLRGTYKRAYDHLDGGIRLLADLHDDADKKKVWSRGSSIKPSVSAKQDCIDTFLAEAFARLRVQMEFSRLRSGTGSTLEFKPSSDLPTLKFNSVHEARHYLDRVFDGVHLLSRAIRDGIHTSWPNGHWNITLTERRFMQGCLDSWLRSYTATMVDLTGTTSDDELVGYKMLRIYHTMAEIMAGTCLSPQQAVFDQYSPGFRSIVDQCTKIALDGAPSKDACNVAGRPDTRRRTWPDISWTPPLYYTAIKCRDHQIRTRAVDLMSSFWCYEIVWDLDFLNISTIIAQEVIRMEEGDFFGVPAQRCAEEMTSIKGFRPDLLPSPSSLPEHRRFDTVEMVILDDVQMSLQIVCKKWCPEGVQIIRKVYDEAECTWAKVKGEHIATSGIRSLDVKLDGIQHQI